jgi:hypothetical protein
MDAFAFALEDEEPTTLPVVVLTILNGFLPLVFRMVYGMSVLLGKNPPPRGPERITPPESLRGGREQQPLNAPL